MKKLILILTLSILCIQFSTAQPDSQAAIFKGMMDFMNTDYPALPSVSNAYELMMTNNTIRTDNTGKAYQYVSFATGMSTRRVSGSRSMTFLTFTNVKQSFMDRGTLTRDRDLLDYKIYLEGAIVKVQVKLRTWGDATSTHNAVISRTVPEGYIVQFKSTNNSNYTDHFTILLKSDILR